MKRLTVIPVLGLLAAGAAIAQPLVVDLSDHRVAITTGFSGAEVLAFGAIDEPGEVVLVVHGPLRPVTMHRKARIAGIWINTASMTFDQAPSFYAVASSRPLDEIASPSVLARNQIGIENLRLELPRAKASPNVAKAWRDALIRTHQNIDLYGSEVARIGFLGSRLFSTRVRFPANVPTGTYRATTYLFVDGRVESAQTTPLIISKAGLEADIFDFAHQQGALYGAIAILVALMAGWLAHIAFRKA
ncbi:MAG: TIGR02186 family protein [Rhodospirillales bacterium]|nr:TIGR02186 family protein [Rhodospirillales bacterium]